MDGVQTPPTNRKLLIIVALVTTVILGAVGIYIAYMIYQAREVTPSESAATSCCSCIWSCEGDGCPMYTTPFASGTENGGACVLDNPITLGTNTVTRCQSVSDLDTEWTVTNLPTNTCNGGCLDSISDPAVVPDPATGEVTFTQHFVLRYAIPPTEFYEQAEMSFVYPEGQIAPGPISATFTEDNGLVTTDNDAVTVELNAYTDPVNSMPIKDYAVTFTTDWDDVINPSVSGTYSVAFRAYRSNTYNGEGDWVTSPYCAASYEVEEQASGELGCESLDIRPTSGMSTLTPTVTATTLLGDTGDPVSYSWQMDLNCDNEYSDDPADSEVFTTIDTPTVSNKTFTYPSGSTSPATCGIHLTINEGSASLPSACDGSVTLRATAASCGNGTCDNGETCDLDASSSLDCRARASGSILDQGYTCRADCTFCGDGVLDAGESCDPGITAGETGYVEGCSDTCARPAQTTGLTVTMQTSAACVERVSPNNTTNFTITVTNPTTSAVAIRAVTDTLPQGFLYMVRSSIINGTANTTDTGVTLETSGNSQLISWNNGGNGWTIAASGGTLTIQFSATAGANAITGTQTNTVTISPANADPIPGQNSIIVAQNCTQPDTGIFDSAFVILIGTALLIIAGAAYYTGFGADKLAMIMKKAGSGVESFTGRISSAKDDMILRISQPQKYMEKKIERTALKKISHRLNASGKNKESRK